MRLPGEGVYIIIFPFLTVWFGAKMGRGCHSFSALNLQIISQKRYKMYWKYEIIWIFRYFFLKIRNADCKPDCKGDCKTYCAKSLEPKGSVKQKCGLKNGPKSGQKIPCGWHNKDTINDTIKGRNFAVEKFVRKWNVIAVGR